MEAKILGIDLGATKTEFGLAKKGKIIQREILPTNAKKGKNPVINLLASQIKKSHASKIGICVAGTVDKGIVIRAPNLKWKNVPLKKILERKTSKKIFVENDAKCFSIAQSKKRKANFFVGITVGTGIGGGIIINGKLFRGKNNSAGEFGHIMIIPNGKKCGCGSYGCLEQYASGTAIERFFYEKTGKRKTALEISKINSAAARESISLAAHYFGIGLAIIISSLSPDLIAVGGGISKIPGFVKNAEKTAKSIAKISKFPRIIRAGEGVLAGALMAAGAFT